MNTLATDSKIDRRLVSGTGVPGYRDCPNKLAAGLVLVCILPLLWTASVFAEPVPNTAAGYVGTATGFWSGKGVSVVGQPDGSCSNMGATGKANFVSNFGFNIPGTATVTGITAFTLAGAANTETVTFRLFSNVLTPTPIGTVQDVEIPGGGGGSCDATDPGQYPAGTPNNNLLSGWGLNSIAPATINSPNFGLGLVTDSQGTVKFDSVCLQIAYTTPSGDADTVECLTAPPKGANLQVVKTVEGAPPGTDWAFNVTGPNELDKNFNLAAAGASKPFSDLEAGSYTITETTKEGWTVAAQCVVNEVPLTDSNAADNIVTITIAEGENVSCSFVNTLNSLARGNAYFRVQKLFMDGNDVTKATFRLDCNTGIPLDQTKTTSISSDTFEVEFVVIEFTQGELNCTLLEDPVVAGYTPSYECDSNSLGVCSVGNESELDNYGAGPCVFTNVDTTQRLDQGESWEHLCVIRNYPNPVQVVINKTWDVAGSETLSIDPYYKLTLTCENEIVDKGAVDEGDGTWSIEFENTSGTSNAKYSAMVIPDWDGGTDCDVIESGQDQAVEPDNECQNLLAKLADGDECTITNTVFYEGIPTLNQYGVAVLALLMLGMGMVGFRRFA